MTARQAKKRRAQARSVGRSGNARAITVRLNCEGAELSDADRRWLRRWTRVLAIAAGLQQAELSLAVVDDRLMRRLHHRHVGSRATTDVLTFDLSDPGERRLEAEIIVCADVARRQGRRLGHAARLEMLLYVVHGLLHLTGFDDHTARHAARMHQRENELLAAAGLPAISVPSSSTR